MTSSTRRSSPAAESGAPDSQPGWAEEASVAIALAKVGQELISSVDLPILLERLCRVTSDVLQCDVSFTLMVSEDSGMLRAVAAHGETPERWEAVRAVEIPLVEPVVAELRRAGVIHQQVARAMVTVPAALSATYALTDSLSVPLVRGDRLVGVQIAGKRAGSGFTGCHERIARGLAQLASLALENARLVDQLETANRLKSDFLATMSHELRTPLNVILGYNELLLDEVFGALTPEQAASLDRVGTSARELLELINATLDISRLETGHAALTVEEIDPVVLLRDIEAETRALREKPGVESVWRIAPRLPRFSSDVVKLKVLLKNLIANAVKFTDRGTVTIAATAGDGGIEFAVADTGIGMTRETQAVIFEPFRQGDGSPTRRQGGVGLGLYIVSRLLLMLRGRIDVESTPGIGSTFRVWIPVNTQQRATEKFAVGS